jgi:hypothetical protein
MRTLIVRSFAIPVFATLTAVSSFGAQDRPSTLLSAPEVSQLITRAQPADHARLSAHFAAQADEQAADAKRHTSMQQAYAGSTKIAAVSMASHCKEIASRSLASEATLREVSAYHSKLAGGASAEVARSTARIEARSPADAELARLAARAETAADHRTLESYFTSLATRYDREAVDHTAHAKTWRALTKVTASAAQATTHDKLAVQLRESAKEARMAATMHEEQAAKSK